MDDGFEHMDGRSAGFQPDAIPPTLPDDLRLFQREFVDGRHHDAVAGGFHLLQGAADLLIFALGLGQLDDAGHQARFVADGKAGLFTEDAVEHIRFEQHRYPHHALGKVHPAEGRALHRIAGKGPGAVLGRDVLHPGDLL